MVKTDLINKLANEMEFSKKDAQIVVDTVFESISKTLINGDKVELRGFGSFKTKEKKAREGRNPKTGAKVKVPAKRVPFFKAGQDLKIVGQGSKFILLLNSYIFLRTSHKNPFEFLQVYLL